MAELIVVLRDGSERKVHAKDGQSVMEAVRDAGVDEMLALCGGCCSCATCHVHVDPAFLGKLPEASETEIDLLGFSTHKDDHSRLSCQLIVSGALDGMRVKIAQED